MLFADITLVVLSVTVISELFVLFVFFFSVSNICFRCLCQTLPVCVATEVIYVVSLCVNRPMFVYF